jgi:hypothetical protein
VAYLPPNIDFDNCNGESLLATIVEREFSDAAQVLKQDADMLLTRQDDWAAGYTGVEYVALGMIVKYAAMHEKVTRITGRNGETFKDEPDKPPLPVTAFGHRRHKIELNARNCDGLAKLVDIVEQEYAKLASVIRETSVSKPGANMALSLSLFRGHDLLMYLKLGMFIKYAGLYGINVTILSSDDAVADGLMAHME